LAGAPGVEALARDADLVEEAAQSLLVELEPRGQCKGPLRALCFGYARPEVAASDLGDLGLPAARCMLGRRASTIPWNFLRPAGTYLVIAPCSCLGHRTWD
jgi:hypothetical protein